VLLAGLAGLLAACTRSNLEPPDVQGAPAMVDDGGQPRLWIVSKQEEWKQIAVGGASSRNRTDWRTDTFFHFRVQAFDPVTARPLWQRTLLTIGDPEAAGTGPSRVIGSDVDARLLGQDGDRVWLLIGDAPLAVSAADGSVIADAQALQQRNPELAGLLPNEAKHYGFDQGLVLMAADARRFVVRGKDLAATAYTPPPPPVDLPPQRADGSYESVPLRPPIGEVPVRQVTLDGQWLGLYSEKEAQDAGNDSFGRHLRWPYTVLDEGALARRSFWRARIATEQRFDERFDRLADLTPVAGAPTFLASRFVKIPGTDDAVRLDDPASVLVWHRTRIDSAGRIALTRLDAGLKPLWTTALPLTEATSINGLTYWLLPGRLVVMGLLQSEDDGVTSREPHLVSVDLRDGAMQAWNMTREAAVTDSAP
jgi:hypothetical protein